MNALLKYFLAGLMALCSTFALGTITANQVTLLNKSSSMAANVQLGTLIQNAEIVDSADITADTIVVSDLNTTVMVEATGTLSQANIIAMYTTPVTLISAPGAGKVIIVDEIEFFHDYATAAYTGGGDATIEYETSGLDINVFDIALVTATADDNWLIKPLTYTSTGTGSSHASLTANANKAVKITNATAVFADGNASNIIKWRIRYHVVTLIT